MAASAGSPVTLHLSQPAKVAELADAPDLGSGGVTHESSSLSFRTKLQFSVVGSQFSGQLSRTDDEMLRTEN